MAGEGALAPRVFVVDLGRPVLDPADRHHIERSLRLRPGDALTAGDGEGRLRPCRLGRHGALEPEGAVVEVALDHPPLTVAFALTKGGRPELAVQKLTELGVDRIVPFTAARSVTRWDGVRADRHLERLRRVAREAAMQCRRAHIPTVADLTGFDEARALPGAALAARDGRPPTLDHPTLMVGPEGGWSPAERGCGLPTVTLGPHVLRAETAAVVAGALLAGLRSGVVAPARIRS